MPCRPGMRVAGIAPGVAKDYLKRKPHGEAFGTKLVVFATTGT